MGPTLTYGAPVLINCHFLANSFINAISLTRDTIILASESSWITILPRNVTLSPHNLFDESSQIVSSSLNQGEDHCIVKGHYASVTCVEGRDLSASEILIVSGSTDKTVRVWTLQPPPSTNSDDDHLITKKAISSQCVIETDASVCCVLLLPEPNNKNLAASRGVAAFTNGELLVFTTVGVQERWISAHLYAAWGLAMVGGLLVSASYDTAIKCWDPVTWQLLGAAAVDAPITAIAGVVGGLGAGCDFAFGTSSGVLGRATFGKLTATVNDRLAAPVRMQATPASPSPAPPMSAPPMSAPPNMAPASSASPYDAAPVAPPPAALVDSTCGQTSIATSILGSQGQTALAPSSTSDNAMEQPRPAAASAPSLDVCTSLGVAGASGQTGATGQTAPSKKSCRCCVLL